MSNKHTAQHRMGKATATPKLPEHPRKAVLSHKPSAMESHSQLGDADSGPAMTEPHDQDPPSYMPSPRNTRRGVAFDIPPIPKKPTIVDTRTRYKQEKDGSRKEERDVEVGEVEEKGPGLRRRPTYTRRQEEPDDVALGACCVLC